MKRIYILEVLVVGDQKVCSDYIFKENVIKQTFWNPPEDGQAPTTAGNLLCKIN